MIRKSGRNEYVEMARESFASLCSIAETIGTTGFDSRQEAVWAISDLWHRLVWSDRALNHHECAVLDAIMDEAEIYGLEFPDAELRNNLHSSPIPALVIHARNYDIEHRTRLAPAAVNHLESFGYALLASDRKINDPELKDLHQYLHQLRSSTELSPEPS